MGENNDIDLMEHELNTRQPNMHHSDQDYSPEKILFEGGPSQIININKFTICGFIFLFAIICPFLYREAIEQNYPDIRDHLMLACKVLFFLPIFGSIWIWLVVRCHRYTITNETLKEVEGVFSRKTEILQLYRVKDITFEQPFSLRMFGCGNIVLDTSDKTTPIVVVYAVRSPQALIDIITKRVEFMRTAKGVREID